MKYDLSSTGGLIPIVNQHALKSILRNGNTLIIDSAQDFFTHLRGICDEISKLFSCRSSANVYGAWMQNKSSFGLHFDGHGVIAYQLEGAKKWSIYKPTHMNPQPEEKSFFFQAPSGT
jgi:ribosomal protein L16 Arg81 hydroxylase